MQSKINCKEVLNQICELENVSDISNLEVRFQEHIKTCSKCTAYLSSLNSTIELYKTYNVELPSDIQKKIVNNVCCKLKSGD
jgi:hypothetical protein